MSHLPACPHCQSTFAYQDGELLVCPECAHEWSASGVEAGDADEAGLVVKDAHGVTLVDGDTVVLVKDLKIKGSSSVVKVGTKVKGVRLVQGDHNIDCKIPGLGAMQLKSEFVKRA